MFAALRLTSVVPLKHRVQLSTTTMAVVLRLALYLIPLAVPTDAGSSTDHVIGCPRTCFCNVLSRVVYCSRRGLVSIPETLPVIGGPATLWQLNLNGNHFRPHTLQRANLSTGHVGSIEHLYMSDCGIELIEVCYNDSMDIYCFLLKRTYRFSFTAALALSSKGV